MIIASGTRFFAVFTTTVVALLPILCCGSVNAEAICSANVHGLPWYLHQGPNKVRVLHAVSYADRPVSQNQRLDLYLPPLRKTPRPVVLWIHGGAWKKGDKRWGPFTSLTNSGFAVASINYRLSGEAAFPAQLEDCMLAVRWIRENADKYNLDSSKIAVWGSSAGAHLAVLMGTDSVRSESRVQAVVDWFGPAFLLDENENVGKRKVVRALLTDSKSESHKELVQKARAASPLYQSFEHCPPMLIMHGDSDRVVPFEHSRRLHELLTKHGVNSTLLKVRGGHGFPSFGLKQQKIAIEFLLRALKVNQTDLE